jgi:hypothetical protein
MSTLTFSMFTAMILVCPIAAATPDKNHNDAFIPGTVDENTLVKEVRHALVTLPYYGVLTSPFVLTAAL